LSVEREARPEERGDLAATLAGERGEGSANIVHGVAEEPHLTLVGALKGLREHDIERLGPVERDDLMFAVQGD
jgi:hypothetical protein